MTKKNGKALQCYFRVGSYSISQIPLNHTVGEISINSKGEEYIIRSTKTYHRNFETALMNLYDRLVSDKAHRSTINSVKGLLEVIKEAKEEILEALK